MKLIIGLFLVATALAYPLGDTEEKPHEPLVISDSYSSVSKSEEIKHDLEKAVQHDDSSSSSEESAESSEKPAEPISTELPMKDDVKEAKKEEKKLEEPEKLEELPKPELKKDEKIEEIKLTEEKKPELKKVPEVPQVKALEPEKVEEKKPLLEEKPLALPAAEKMQEKSASASEIKEEIVALQSEQKVEAPAAAEEKAPELKSTLIVEEKKDIVVEPTLEKKAKSAEEPAPAAPITDLPQLAASEEPKPVILEEPLKPSEEPLRPSEDLKPAMDQVASDAKPESEVKPEERIPEGKSAEPVKEEPIRKDEPKPEEPQKVSLTEEKPAKSSS